MSRYETIHLSSYFRESNIFVLFCIVLISMRGMTSFWTRWRCSQGSYSQRSYTGNCHNQYYIRNCDTFASSYIYYTVIYVVNRSFIRNNYTAKFRNFVPTKCIFYLNTGFIKLLKLGNFLAVLPLNIWSDTLQTHSFVPKRKSRGLSWHNQWMASCVTQLYRYLLLVVSK